MKLPTRRQQVDNFQTANLSNPVRALGVKPCRLCIKNNFAVAVHKANLAGDKFKSPAQIRAFVDEAQSKIWPKISFTLARAGAMPASVSTI